MVDPFQEKMEPHDNPQDRKRDEGEERIPHGFEGRPGDGFPGQWVSNP